MNAATATRTATAILVTLPNGEVRKLSGKATVANTTHVSIGQWSDDGSWVVSKHGTLDAASKNAKMQSHPAYVGGPRWTNVQVVAVN